MSELTNSKNGYFKLKSFNVLAQGEEFFEAFFLFMPTGILLYINANEMIKSRITHFCVMYLYV